MPPLLPEPPHPPPFACRSCAHTGLDEVLWLGHLPLANALLSAEQLNTPERTYPLRLVFCPRCSLVQIDVTVPPEELFRTYLYFSSFSASLVEHARVLVEENLRTLDLGPSSQVVEIASNDGYLLQHYHRAGVPVLGIEPARNIARAAREQRGIPTLPEFFGRELGLALRAEGLRADVIHAHNVLGHVAELNGFVEGLGVLLAPGGVAIIEVPYVRDLIEHTEFDTIYHEHLSYFSLTALDTLFHRHGLVLTDVERLAIHGGSLRVRVRGSGERGASVQRLLREEAEWGVGDLSSYAGFGTRVEALRNGLRELLVGLRREGRRLAAYGASAKGSILLNSLGLGGEVLEFVVDRSTVKQGRYMPGTQLPILPPEALLERGPDYALLLTWNFAHEILGQQQEYRRRGGRFIVPIPSPHIIGALDA